MGDDFSITFDMFAKQANEYRKIFSKTYNKLCQFMSEDEIFYEKLQAASNLPPKGDCPVKAGEMWVKNCLIEAPNIPSIVRSQRYWKMVLVLHKQKVNYLQADIYFQVV